MIRVIVIGGTVFAVGFTVGLVAGVALAFSALQDD